MRERIRNLLPILIVSCLALPAVASAAGATRAAGATGGPLTGTWSGDISGSYGSRVPTLHVRLTVNAKETGGTWRINSSCYGTLVLQSISDGFHHYLQKPAAGASCAGGNVYCLERSGAGLYDDVTSRISGQYDSAGTLRRVK